MKIKRIVIILLLAAVIVLIIFGLYSYRLSIESSQKNKKVESEELYPFGFAGIVEKEELLAAKELKTKIVREGITWHEIEKKDDVFDFTKLDSGYDKLTSEYGLQPIVRLKTKQGWGTKCNTTNLKCPSGYKTCPHKSADCPPKDLGGWTNKGYSPLYYDFVYKILEHAFNTERPINILIVGNEVNSRVFWHGTADEFLKTRTTVFKAVKDFNSKYKKDVKVSDNGFAGSGPAFIREQYCSGKTEYALRFAIRNYKRRFTANQVRNAVQKIDCSNPGRDYTIIKELFKVDENLGEPSFDYMAYHFYAPWDTQKEIIDWIKQEMEKNGYQRPILQTEGGFGDYINTYNNSAVAQEVAKEIPKLHVVALANDVKTWLWLPLREKWGEDFYGPQYKGLLLPDLTELPAFKSYQVMVEKLDGFNKVEQLTGYPVENIYKFTIKNKSVYVIWTDKTTKIDLTSELKDQITITGVDGSSTKQKSSTISIGESPIYVSG